MNINDIVGSVWAVCGPQLDGAGYELVEVEMANQFGQRILRLYIDKPGHGISLNDCTAATRLLNPVLDEHEALGDQYMLEVSSPGSDRPIRKAEHFARYAEKQVAVRLESHDPVNGRKKFKGTLTGFENGDIRVECDGQPFVVRIENVKRCNIDR